MEKNSKIYVAGHRGLVGSAIVRKLKELGYTNIITKTHAELDLTDQKATRKFFEKERPEYVFLAAAKVGGILANNTYKAEFIYQNIMIAANVIEASYRYGVKKLLNLGSSCIYPKYAKQPMKEEYLLTGELEPTNEPYAIAKISAIKMCRYFNEQYGTNFISVMPTNLYGPNDNFNLETAHVLPALLRKFYLGKLLEEENYEKIKENIQKYPLGFGYDEKIDLNNKESIIEILKQLGITKEAITLWGSGEVYREFMYVDDLADACVYLMNNYDYKDIGEFVNIGTGKDIKIKELARLIKEIVGYDGKIVHDKSKPDGTPRKLLDVSRFNELGWKYKIELDEGIRKSFEWYERIHTI
ncbi:MULTISPECIES: GDP-L-fucose synthase [unclassified Thermosipho (in: thermotogales)]|uniref:GDP-L-fucose synthase family protein n=1 Tax=unclassified Thermosipho (in: thermotogales) TaxID=2676525 RepID=UPI00098702E6|nr:MULTISPECIES: GDP-L-fucose synthase [unclassified Thermosipho (in: thermotogales)]MBT1247049.1 GDP-fucose synthetase [Thermosipho sp. 1244]OOC46905.1 epimerase [Thermosipho sp. 1223]